MTTLDATPATHPALADMANRPDAEDEEPLIGLSTLDLMVRYSDEKLSRLSPFSISLREGALLRFAKWLQPKSLLDATSGDISAWLDGQNLARGTRGQRVGWLHGFYNWLLNEGEIDRDPAAPLLHVRQPITAGELPQLLRGHLIAQERQNLAPGTIEVRARLVRQLLAA